MLKPGLVQDAIVAVLIDEPAGLPTKVICERVVHYIEQDVPQSSIRSSLRLNTPKLFKRTERGIYALADNHPVQARLNGKRPSGSKVLHGKATLYHDDCFDWLRDQPSNHYHGVVTDPPYGVTEFSRTHDQKRVNGNGGNWRIPPSFDGVTRTPVPRFTGIGSGERSELFRYFRKWARALYPALVPGGHVMVASNPLVSWTLNAALVAGGFEPRGQLVRLVQTLRGGDRPKNAHVEYEGVSTMPRSQWEPWIIVRKPLEGRVQDNLRKYGTGGLRRPSSDQPFGDVFRCPPASRRERQLTNHPTLKPQKLLRHLVRAVLPLGQGIVLDPFAGSGSTLAAANAVQYQSVGVEVNEDYFLTGLQTVKALADLDFGVECASKQSTSPELFKTVSMKSCSRRTAC